MKEIANNGPHTNQKLDRTLALGCASLFEEIGKRIMIIQMDGKKIVGVLGSVDHYGNMFLYEASERVYVGNCKGKFGDIPVGAIIVRGDSLAMMCEIDGDLEQKVPTEKVSVEKILQIQQDEAKLHAEKAQKIMVGLRERGIKHVAREAGFCDEM